MGSEFLSKRMELLFTKDSLKMVYHMGKDVSIHSTHLTMDIGRQD